MNDTCLLVTKIATTVFQGISKLSQALDNRQSVGKSLRTTDESAEPLHLGSGSAWLKRDHYAVDTESNEVNSENHKV